MIIPYRASLGAVESRCSRPLREGLLHDRRGAIVGFEQVTVDVERDRWRAVAEAAADGQYIEASGDQRRGVGVAQRVQRRL